MQCPFCFQEIPRGTKKCPICQKELLESTINDDLVLDPDAPEATSESVPPAPHEIMKEEGAFEEKIAPVPDNAQVILEAPPKRGKAAVVLAVLGVFIALAAVLFFLKDSITGLVLRNFSEPVTYFSYVEGKSFGDAVGDWFEAKAETERENKNKGMITTHTLKISEDISLLAEDLDESVADLIHWLDDFGITLDTDHNNGVTSTKVSLKSKGLGILDLIATAEGDSMILTAPEMTDKALLYRLENGAKLNPFELLPEDRVAEEMIRRYYTILFDHLTDVTGEEGVYTRQDGVEEEAFVLTVRVTEKQLHNILSALVAEAKEDAELKKLYESLADYYVALEVADKDEVKDWDRVIADLEDELAEAKDSFEGEGEELFVLTDYVNSDHEVIGRKITTCQEESFLFSYYKDERDVDFILRGEEVCLTLAGEVVDDHAVVSGELVISDTRVLDIKLNWGEEDLSLRLDLSDEMQKSLVQFLGGEESLGQFKNYMDLGLQLDVDTDDNLVESEIGLYASDKRKIAIESEIQVGEAEKVEMPKVQDPLDLKDADDIEEFITSFDTEKLMKALKDAGFPDGIL